MTESKTQTTRAINCRGCRVENKCLIELSYNDTGRITAARVAELPPGWKSLPYGEAGGEAPYCPECLSARVSESS